MKYPTYLIHYGIPGQKWGERRFQNEDGTWTEEGLRRRREQFISETKETAHKVAGIITGQQSDKELSQKEMRQLVNKYQTYEPIKNKNGEYSDKYKELVKKGNRNDGFNKDADKRREWEKIEESRIKDPSELFKEKAIRKDRIKDIYKLSDEEAETKLTDINKKISTYNKAIETYLNSSLLKKSMKELNVELKDIYNEDDYKTDYYTPDEAQKVLGFKVYKDSYKKPIKQVNTDDLNERMKKFRQQYGY